MSTDSHQSAGDDTTAPHETTSANKDESETETEPAGFTGTIRVGYVQRFLDAIRTIDDKCRLHLSPGGITGCVVGPENATLAEVRLGTNAFDAYDTDGESGVIGVSTKRLREIVRMSNNSDLMKFDLNDAGQSLRVRAGALDCSLRLIDPATIRATDGFDDDDDDDGDNDGDDDDDDDRYPSVVVLEGGELKRLMKAAGHVGHTVGFRVEWTSERFVVEAEGDTDSFRAPREPADLVELFVGNEPVGATFDLSYLRKVKRAIRKRTEVTLTLGTDLPLSVEFDIGDGAGHVEYGIAPVVEAD